MSNVFIDKKTFENMCHYMDYIRCQSILGINECKECLASIDGCCPGNPTCGNYLFNYLVNNQEKENDKGKLTEWKFAMPSGEIAKTKCRDKLFHLGFKKPDYAFYYSDETGLGGFDNFDYYYECLKEYEELTLSKFLALPEPQQKKKLPEWVIKIIL